MLSEVGIVVIGRNEGERLRACMGSVSGKAARVVYVDSGSTDGSAKLAAESGAVVIELDSQSAFTAARGRNAGAARLLALDSGLEFIQFIDGDCELIDGWLEAGLCVLRGNEKLAAVCGRRKERFPDRSIYNALMDIEWDTPVGEVKSVGGDAMFRARAFQSAGGFALDVFAGEEPELCLRLRMAGWTIARINQEMTRHDANILSFRVWWRRQMRSGHGAVLVNARAGDGARGERPFTKMLFSIRLWTTFWLYCLLFLALIGSMAFGTKGGLLCGGILLLAYPAQILKIAWETRRRGYAMRLALAHGCFTMLGKWGMRLGSIYYRPT